MPLQPPQMEQVKRNLESELRRDFEKKVIREVLIPNLLWEINYNLTRFFDKASGR